MAGSSRTARVAALRTVGEILSAPPTPEERRALRREAVEAEARPASAQDAADTAATQGFIARMNGHAPRDVLADAAGGDGLDREQHSRRRAAVEILKRYDLADVITGGASGCVIDPHLGILEPVPDVAQRGAMDRQYEFERSQREADERNRFIARAKVQLDARRRALGLDSPRLSHRSAVQPVPAGCSRARYDAHGFCGCLPCFGFEAEAEARASQGRASYGTDYFGRPVTAGRVSVR
jgi:hypothetical protein